MRFLIVAEQPRPQCSLATLHTQARAEKSRQRAHECTCLSIRNSDSLLLTHGLSRSLQKPQSKSGASALHSLRSRILTVESQEVPERLTPENDMNGIWVPAVACEPFHILPQFHTSDGFRDHDAGAHRNASNSLLVKAKFR